MIGIVGRSGSGKSTLARLVQRLYVPEQGRILIDGCDIALAAPDALRRQIGVVPQECFLFSGSVRENIALGDPGMPLERVMHAARLAGAHEFIVELPYGYDTPLGEHAHNLSGGQRQRLAIARALVRDPRILVFDEATSALDYESESVVRANLEAICAGRTVIIIAHRLSALARCQRILVLDRGRLVEQGTPSALLAAVDCSRACTRCSRRRGRREEAHMMHADCPPCCRARRGVTMRASCRQRSRCATASPRCPGAGCCARCSCCWRCCWRGR